MWIEKSAAQGNPRGRYLLGLLLLEGRAGLDKNLPEAVRLIRAAAEAADPVAQYRLALLYGTGNGVEKSDASALDWLRRAADAHLPKAEFMLASIYGAGLYGVVRNDKEAVKWLRRSALQEYADAEYSLGLAYAEGRGVEQDPSAAFGWMRRAARRGHGPAMEQVRRIEAQVKERQKSQ
jgi:TPR repeat protein